MNCRKTDPVITEMTATCLEEEKVFMKPELLGKFVIWTALSKKLDKNYDMFCE
jgi:hypothetical protein